MRGKIFCVIYCVYFDPIYFYAEITLVYSASIFIDTILTVTFGALFKQIGQISTLCHFSLACSTSFLSRGWHSRAKKCRNTTRNRTYSLLNIRVFCVLGKESPIRAEKGVVAIFCLLHSRYVDQSYKSVKIVSDICILPVSSTIY
jgi:hypothetical protein